jgi:hypothetical protein
VALAQIKLASGREIKLTELVMESTYGGFLEGYPCAQINDRILSLLEDKTNRRYPYTPVYVVTPSTAILDDHGGSCPFGRPEVLPSVICTGCFTSGPVSSDPGVDLSSLVVVWFQDDIIVPTRRDVPLCLRDLRWDELAADGAY